LIRELGEQGTDQLPDEWLIQCHQQANIYGTNRVHLLALIACRECRLFTVEVDPVAIARIQDGVVRFWREHVLAKVPPPATAADLKVLAAIRPEADTEIRLDQAGNYLATEWLSARERASDAAKVADARKAELLQSIGTAERAVASDGTVFRRRVVQRKGYTVAATDYVSLTVHRPKEDR